MWGVDVDMSGIDACARASDPCKRVYAISEWQPPLYPPPTIHTQLVKKTFVKKEEIMPLQMAEARGLVAWITVVACIYTLAYIRPLLGLACSRRRQYTCIHALLHAHIALTTPLLPPTRNR